MATYPKCTDQLNEDTGPILHSMRQVKSQAELMR